MKTFFVGILSLSFVLILGLAGFREASGASTRQPCDANHLVCHDGFDCVDTDSGTPIVKHCCKQPTLDKNGVQVCRGPSEPITDPNDSTIVWCCL